MLLYELAGKRIWVTGDRGMVGSALLRALEQRGNATILTVSRDQVDLRDQARVTQWVAAEKPQVVLLVAAKTGGLLLHQAQPADFIYDNLMIESNIIHASYRARVEKLLFVSSSAVYPRCAQQPIREEALLTGPLEPVHEAYGLAKIAGIKLCQAYRRQHGCDFISAIPANVYGPNDHFDPATSSVLPALLCKFHGALEQGAQSITLWGTGTPRRDFMHVDDLVDGLIFLIEHYSGDMHVNLATGHDIEIRELASVIQNVVGFQGRVVYDVTKPDGTYRKLMDTSRLNALGWRPQTPLLDGITSTYRWFVENKVRLRGQPLPI